MKALISRYTLDLSDRNILRYSVARGETEPAHGSPLLLCLHPGWNGDIPAEHYGEQFLASLFLPAFAETGAVIVAPDCPAGAWNNPTSCRAIRQLLDHLVAHEGIHQRQISLVGYSAGGWGAWYFLQQIADRFCSAIMLATLPIIDPVDRLMDNIPKCEEVLSSRRDEWLSNIPDLPLYIVHGLEDELIPYKSALSAHQALLAEKKPAVFESVQGAGHYDGERYVVALNASVPWLMATWNP